MIKNLEYLQKLFYETLLFIYRFGKLIYFLFTNKKCEPTIYNNQQKTKNEINIKYEKNYLINNIHILSDFIITSIIFTAIYQIIVNVGLVEIIKLFV